jgi:hypothetical protein
MSAFPICQRDSDHIPPEWHRRVARCIELTKARSDEPIAGCGLMHVADGGPLAADSIRRNLPEPAGRGYHRFRLAYVWKRRRET